jgi:allantoicase
VARLRVHGEPVPDQRVLGLGELVDLAATEHGGRIVGCSNGFYGNPGNLLLPGLARTMGEGWETARRRDDGNDWVLVRLGLPGTVRLAELDTSHFKGNAPGWARLSATASTMESTDPSSADWVELLPRTRLQPDTRHRFLVEAGPVATHVRLDIYPDGGMARLRLHGSPIR